MTLICKKCGATLNENQKFCTKCGETVVISPPMKPGRKTPSQFLCEKCGEAYQAGQKFCKHCGSSLPEKSESSSQKKDSTTSPKTPPPLLCEKCKEPYQADQKFCKHCGSPLPEKSKSNSQKKDSTTSPKTPPPLLCEKCKEPYQAGQKFCKHCGSPLPEKSENSSQKANTKAPKADSLKKAGKELDPLLRKILASLKDTDLQASPSKGAVNIPMTKAQNQFVRLMKNGLLSLVCILLLQMSMVQDAYAKPVRMDGDPYNIMSQDEEQDWYSDYFDELHKNRNYLRPLTDYMLDSGGSTRNFGLYQGQYMWYADISFRNRQRDYQIIPARYGSDSYWNFELESENSDDTNADLVFTATCKVGDVLQMNVYDWWGGMSASRIQEAGWTFDDSINSDRWQDSYDFRNDNYTLKANIKAARYDNKWAPNATAYEYEPEAVQSHLSSWQYEVEEGDDVIYADAEFSVLAPSVPKIDDYDSSFTYSDDRSVPFHVRVRVKYLVEDTPYARSGGSTDPDGSTGGSSAPDSSSNTPTKEPVRNYEEYIIDTTASDKSGDVFTWLPPVIGTGGFFWAVNKFRKKRRAKRSGMKNQRFEEDKPSNKKKAETSKKKEEKKEEKKEDENEDDILYEMRIYKDFGDTLFPGGDPVPVYARIIEIDKDGNSQTNLELTRQINISSPEYLSVQNQQMAGEDKAAHIVAPVLKGETPDSAIVEFSLSTASGRFANRMHFKVDNASIEFLQENLGLPAHYEKEARLLFGLLNLPEDTVVTADISGRGKCPYEVTIEQSDEDPRLYFAVITDTVMDDKADPGTTTSWTLKVEAYNPATKKTTTKEFDIFRIFMGLSLELEANALGCYLDENGEPCVTEGRFMLLEWDDENQEIVKIAPAYDPEDPSRTNVAFSFTATKVENDRIASHGEAKEEHQQLLERIGLTVRTTTTIDNQGARIFRLRAIRAALDKPTRLTVRFTATIVYNGHEYSASRDILLHSMPFRDTGDTSAYLKLLEEDKQQLEYLSTILARIRHWYMDRLFSLYNMIDRMIDGYDPRFGYDKNQYMNVQYIWMRFVYGETPGANAEAEPTTLADELSAYYAFLQGMRDNGGLLGRFALGVCTAGYSETVFFAMDLYEKMEHKVMTLKEGEDFGFWDGVQMGAKEYSINVATELLWGGLLKQGNLAIKNFSGLDIAAKCTSAYQGAVKAGDQALRSTSKLYAAGAKGMDGINNFLNTSAKSLKQARDTSAQERANAQNAVDEITKKPWELTFGERRSGNYGANDVKGDVIQIKAMNKVRKLKQLQDSIHRGSPDYWECKKAYEDYVVEIIQDPNAKQILKSLDNGEANTIRAEFNRVRDLKNQAITEQLLENISERTGRPKEELYIVNVSSNKSADLAAGKTISMDLDITVAQKVYSSQGNDIIIGQTIATEELGRAVFQNRTGHAPVNAEELQAGIRMAEKMEMTYVAPGGDYGYVIEHNPEAYFELDKMINKKSYNEALESPTMTQKTIVHKAREEYLRGDACMERINQLKEKLYDAKQAEKGVIYAEIEDLRYEANGHYLNGTYQVQKTVNKIADPRNDYAVSRGEASAFTERTRKMQALSNDLINKNITEEAFNGYLQSHFGVDRNGFAEEMSKVFH